MQVFVFKNGQQTGPFSLDQVQANVRAGLFGPADLCWYDGLANWTPLAVLPTTPPVALGAHSEPPPTALVPPRPVELPRAPVAPQPAVEAKTSATYGGFWIRVGATFVDLVVMLIPLLLISFLHRSVAQPATDTERVAFEFMDNVFINVAWWVYEAVLTSSAWQGTIGKKLCGLKVTDYNGRRISFGRATGRYFAKILSALLLMIGFIMVGWTQRKQGLHDFMANTLVIRDRK